MATEAEKLILTMLRRLDDKIEQISFDVRELKVRVNAVGENAAVAQRRLDRLEHRFDRSKVED